jgi:hypothetical protein
MLKFFINLANFVLSLVFGGLALASALFTGWNAAKLFVTLGGTQIRIEHEDTFLLFGVVTTFIAYAITAALRGWSNPLGKRYPGNDNWQ